MHKLLVHITTFIVESNIEVISWKSHLLVCRSFYLGVCDVMIQ
jgi:hypothetical protein